MNRISFLNRGYAFKGLLAVVNIPPTITVACCHLYDLTVLLCKILYDKNLVC